MVWKWCKSCKPIAHIVPEIIRKEGMVGYVEARIRIGEKKKYKRDKSFSLSAFSRKNLADE